MTANHNQSSSHSSAGRGVLKASEKKKIIISHVHTHLIANLKCTQRCLLPPCYGGMIIINKRLLHTLFGSCSRLECLLQRVLFNFILILILENVFLVQTFHLALAFSFMLITFLINSAKCFSPTCNCNKIN